MMGGSAFSASSSQGSTATLDVFDLSGRTVLTIPLDTEAGGEIQTVWNGMGSSGRPVSSGVYYCRLRTDSDSCVQPVLMLN